MTETGSEIEAFIARWATAGGGERSNYQLFLTELCVLLQVAIVARGPGRLSFDHLIARRLGRG